MSNRALWRSWVLSTWVGWILGVPLIIVLALTAEAVGIGGVQVMVGAGMGMGVGYMQGRVLRRLFHRSVRWLWPTSIGMAAPFLAADLAPPARLNLVYSLHYCVALGGLIAGVWQASILREHLTRTRWWVLGSAVGWTLASAITLLADARLGLVSLRGISGALLYLATIVMGGLILGMVTATTLTRLRK